MLLRQARKQTCLIGVAGNSDAKTVIIFIKLHFKHSKNWRRQRLHS